MKKKPIRSLVQRLERHRWLEAREAQYSLDSSILATSNKVERLFSVARTALGQKSVMAAGNDSFLREFPRFWDVSTVDQLL